MFTIETIEVTPFQQNARLLYCPETKEAVVIDPGGDADLIAKRIEERGLSLQEIWLTHSHLDHCGGVADLKEVYDVPLLGHRIEEEMRKRVLDICSMYGLPKGTMKNCPEPERYIDEGDELSVGSYPFTILFTPGHSPGHLCFYHAPSHTLIAGDTLFSGSIGRTDLPGGDHPTLIKSIQEKIFTLPDETQVLPGHGPATTVAMEKQYNPFFQG